MDSARLRSGSRSCLLLRSRQFALTLRSRSNFRLTTRGIPRPRRGGEAGGGISPSRAQLEIGLMLAREAGGEVRVAASDRVEDRLVAFGDGMHVDIGLE